MENSVKIGEVKISMKTCAVHEQLNVAKGSPERRLFGHARRGPNDHARSVRLPPCAAPHAHM